MKNKNLIKSDVKYISYPSGDGDFDGNRDDAGHDAAVECADEVEGIVVRIDESDPISRFDVDLGRLEPDAI